MNPPLLLYNNFFYNPTRAAALIGLSDECLFKWAARCCTGYGYKITVIEHAGRLLIAERDVRIMADVQRAFPVRRGPVHPDRQKQMRIYAARLARLRHR